MSSNSGPPVPADALPPEQTAGHAPSPPLPPAGSSSQPSVRIYMRANGHARGVVARIPDSFAKLLQVADSKLPRPIESSRYSRLFLASGDEIHEDTVHLIASNDVVYASCGEPFLTVPVPLHRVPSSSSCGMCSGADFSEIGSVHTGLSEGRVQSLRIDHGFAASDPPFPRRQLVITFSVLAHQLQRERGAACTWMASGGSLRSFADMINAIRPSVDSTLEAIRGCDIDAFSSRVSEVIVEARESVQRFAPLSGSCATSHLQDDGSVVPVRLSPNDCASAFYSTLRIFSNACELVLKRASEVADADHSACGSAATFVQFSRFKEAHARIRGFLSAALALPEEALPSIPARAYADLVICVNQARIHQTTLLAASFDILRVIKPAFELDGALQHVWDQLETDFDLKSVRSELSPAQCWHLFTGHIDKLKLIEELLIAKLKVHDSDSQIQKANFMAQTDEEKQPMPNSTDDRVEHMNSVKLASFLISQLHEQTRGVKRARLVEGEQSDALDDASLRSPLETAASGSAMHAGEEESSKAVHLAAPAVALSLAEAQNMAKQISDIPAQTLKSALCGLLTGQSYSNDMAEEFSEPVVKSDGDASAVSHRERSSMGRAISHRPSDDSRTVSEQKDTTRRKSQAASSSDAPRWKGDQEVEADWLIPIADVILERRIGVGSSGTTYIASWRGVHVAVKVAGNGVSHLSEWKAEMSALTRLRHPNIVQYMGAIIEPPTLCLVLQYCPGGDVGRVLRGLTPKGFFLLVANGVAAGMSYLHRRGIMHRDLKSANVLIDSGGVVKLTDFGVAIQIPENNTNLVELTAETGTLRWMAPEVARHERYRKSADVYSFAMLLFELVTHQFPFADRLPLQAVVASALQGLRPPLPEGMPQSVVSLVQRCWDARASERPTFDHIQEALVKIETGMHLAEKEWLDEPYGHQVYQSTKRTESSSCGSEAAE